MPGEQTEGRFSADAESSLRLEAAVQEQVNAFYYVAGLSLILFCSIISPFGADDAPERGTPFELWVESLTCARQQAAVHLK